MVGTMYDNLKWLEDQISTYLNACAFTPFEVMC
jgi:hypothetical protein